MSSASAFVRPPRAPAAIGVGGAILFGAALISVGGAAAGQTLNASAASFSTGYHAISGEFNGPVNVSTRDANGATIIVDGVIQSGVGGSIFNRHTSSGASGSLSGGVNPDNAGLGGVATGVTTTFNPPITVVTNGPTTTVTVNAPQSADGAYSPGQVLNGLLNLNGG